MSTSSHAIILFSTVIALGLAVLIQRLNTKKQPIALSSKDFRSFELISKLQFNSNTFRFIFDLKDKNAVLGLSLGQCISIRATNPKDNKLVTRSYTPISRLNTAGQVELLIKVYPNGVVTNVLKNLKIGDSIEMRGPKGNFKYTPSKLSKILMIAGGSGITPMYQVINEIMRDPTDTTKVSLLYANVTSADILLHDELQELAETFKDRFEVFYILEKPPQEWDGGVGFVSKDLIEKHVGSTASDKQALLCGPPPMIKAMEAHLEAVGFEQAKIISKPDDQIFKF